MQIRWCILWGLVLLCVPTLAYAHPGHGHTDPVSPAHYVAESVHVVPVVLAVSLVLAVLLFGAWRTRRRDPDRPR